MSGVYYWYDSLLAIWRRRPAVYPSRAEDIHSASMRFPAIEDAWGQIARLESALHKHNAHPDFEYLTTKCGRKQYMGEDALVRDGWEENIIDGDTHSSWERFDYHEDHYWRRRKGSIPTSAPEQS